MCVIIEANHEKMPFHTVFRKHTFICLHDFYTSVMHDFSYVSKGLYLNRGIYVELFLTPTGISVSVRPPKSFVFLFQKRKAAAFKDPMACFILCLLC